MENQNNSIGIKIVVYKEILPGDFRKFKAASNDATTGGGARDLRFNPGAVFEHVFSRMFTLDESTGIMKGEFHWSGLLNTAVEIYPPTTARPGEIRISKVHQCFPKSIVPQDSADCILLIVQDSNNEVWPYFTTSKSLREDDWHPSIKKYILEGLAAIRRKDIAADGYIDFEKGDVFTNGK